MMKCDKCGFECNDSAKFCENCGNKLLKEPAADEKLLEESSNTVQQITVKQNLETDSTSNLKHNPSVSPVSDKAIQFDSENVYIDRSKLKKWCILGASILAIVILLIVLINLINDNDEPITPSGSFYSDDYQTESSTETTSDTTTESTTKSKKELEEEKQNYINSCETYSYKTLERDPDNYYGKRVKFTGEVIQVLDYDTLSFAIYRINVNKSEYGNYTDTVYVTYFVPDNSSRILEDDIVTFYGTYQGLYTYESTLGSSVTVPKVNAEYIDIDIPSE